MKNLFIAVSLISALAACTSENAEELFPTMPAVSDSTVISFASEIRPLLKTKCTDPGCHRPNGTRASTPLIDYTQIKAAVDNLGLKSQIESRNMPQTGSLSPNQLSLIVTWIDRGAKDN